jgi:hypothetical protein
MNLAAGQSWSYRAPQGFETSRLMIGAIARVDTERSIICCAVVHAPRRHADGHLDLITIPFLPMTEAAFLASVVALDEAPAELPQVFVENLETWSQSPEGLAAFTVPFDGFLDQLVARQTAEALGRPAA